MTYDGPERRKLEHVALTLHDVKAMAFMLKTIQAKLEQAKHDIDVWREYFDHRCTIIAVHNGMVEDERKNA